jgi:tRNA(fMet)-specific endonuclease VapC
MSYLVDTDWVIDYLKARTQAVQLLQSLASEGLSISIITYGEVYEGIVDSPDSARHERGLLDLLSWVEVITLTQSSMKLFAELRSDLRRQGQLITDFDLLIAATAIEKNLTLITRNRRHFERVPNLLMH